MKGTQGHSWKGAGFVFKLWLNWLQSSFPQPLGIKLSPQTLQIGIYSLTQIWSAFWLWSAFLSIFLFYSLPEVDVSWDTNFSFLRCPPLLLSFSHIDTYPCHPLHLCTWMWHHKKKGVGPWNPASWAAIKEPDGASGSVCLKVISLWSQSWTVGSGRRDESDRWLFPSIFPVLLWGSLSSWPIWVLGDKAFWEMCWIS